MSGAEVVAMLPVLVLACGLAFWALSILDFARSNARGVRTLPRDAWVVILVLGSVVGAAAWWTFGRPRQE